jgi:CRISPR-associated protein Csm2
MCAREQHPHHSNTGGAPPRSGGTRNDWRWSEEKAADEIRGAFGSDYVSFILSPNKPDYNGYIEKVKRYVFGHYRKMTTSQLRNVFSRVRNIKNPQQLYLLRPKLAYVAGRSETDEMKTMLYLIDQLISKVDNTDKLEQFKSFYEAVIAYHKYYGGKE